VATSQRKVVVVTGATAGVGRAIARAFAGRGWRVALLARESDALAETAAEVGRLGGEAMGESVDVADYAAVSSAMQRVVQRWDGIDVWINNAMATVFGPVGAIPAEEFARVTSVTYLGTVHGTLAALRHMQPKNQGTIVQVGSALSYRAIPLQSAYCAAKFATRGFTDSLRCELIHDRSAIRISMVQLPAVNTPQFDWARSHMPRRMQPVPPIHAPDAIAEIIASRIERMPRELWIGTPTLKAILGQLVIPALLDRMLARKAWDGQMTGETEAGHRDDLFEPVPALHRTDGRFGDQARTKVFAFDASHLRVAFALVAMAIVVAMAVLLSWALD
jgi:NAD(P)-dependent dehydrogenase (short-subunit alcohol dehydrogenase family)